MDSRKPIDPSTQSKETAPRRRERRALQDTAQQSAKSPSRAAIRKTGENAYVPSGAKNVQSAPKKPGAGETVKRRTAQNANPVNAPKAAKPSVSHAHAGTVKTVRRASSAQTAKSRAQARKAQSNRRLVLIAGAVALALLLGVGAWQIFSPKNDAKNPGANPGASVQSTQITQSETQKTALSNPSHGAGSIQPTPTPTVSNATPSPTPHSAGGAAPTSALPPSGSSSSENGDGPDETESANTSGALLSSDASGDQTDPEGDLSNESTPTPTPSPTATPVPDPTKTPKPVKLQYNYEIEVDKSKQVVTVYTVDQDGYYKLIVKQFICSTGHCDKVEDGWYRIGEKSRWKKMGNGSYAQYASRISGPYLFHSACYYSMSVGQLKVRYYENLGTNASSGCIRLTAASAYWLYNNCPKGTPIHVITSGERDEALLEALKPPALISQKYDPTDPEAPEKYQYKPETEPAPDATPYPGVTPAPTPSWTVHPTLKAWGYC